MSYVSIAVFGWLLFLACIYSPLMVDASQHKWSGMINALRYLQETMLSVSMERAKLNYDIYFECRTTTNKFRGNETHFNMNLGNMRNFRRLSPNRKLAFFLHGWNDETSKGWIQDLLRTWTHFKPNYNVCVVDWGHLSHLDYKSATMSIFEVGLTVAGFIVALEQRRPNVFSRQNVTIAGYSLGAHAAGYAGAMLDGNIEQIIGLDPAGPLFTMPAAVSPQYRLDKTDAQFVQVLHTAGGTLGSTLKCGHADFFPNGGTAPQPNCRMFMGLEDMTNQNPISCSHSTAPIFFKQSMDPEYPFYGYHCDSKENFMLGYCNVNTQRYGRFGIHSKREVKGNFYFTTSQEKPYVPHRRISVALIMWQQQQQQQQQRQRQLVKLRQFNRFSNDY